MVTFFQLQNFEGACLSSKTSITSPMSRKTNPSVWLSSVTPTVTMQRRRREEKVIRSRKVSQVRRKSIRFKCSSPRNCIASLAKPRRSPFWNPTILGENRLFLSRFSFLLVILSAFTKLLLRLYPTFFFDSLSYSSIQVRTELVSPTNTKPPPPFPSRNPREPLVNPIGEVVVEKQFSAANRGFEPPANPAGGAKKPTSKFKQMRIGKWIGGARTWRAVIFPFQLYRGLFPERVNCGLIFSWISSERRYGK